MNKLTVQPNLITLRKVMRDADVSQTDLADRMGVKRQSVSAWLAGDMPVGRYFEAMCVITGAAYDTFGLWPMGMHLVIEEVE
jgi:transcriptional regulator with XRE-family HTH domain